jgi:membrane protease YdiL (CAAX protease family)
MSMVAATLDPAHASLVPAPTVPDTKPRPWGFWATLGWGLFALVGCLMGVIACYVVWMLTHQFRIADADYEIYRYIARTVASVAPIVVLIAPIAIRKSSQLEYFGLRAFSWRDLLLGIVCLAGLSVAMRSLWSWFDLDGGGSEWMESTYQSATLGGALALLWINVVVIGPVTEELFFRGFLHRGWASSWLGVVGTVVLTSGLWAMLHQQYNWAGIFYVFCDGLIYGWLRQRSGSTTLAIGLHVLWNLYCMVKDNVSFEWLSP